MKRPTIQVWNTVETESGETDLLFSFDYTPEERGGRDSYGQATEPDSPARMEFLEATDADGKEIGVEESDIETAEGKAWDEVFEPSEPDRNEDWSLD